MPHDFLEPPSHGRARRWWWLSMAAAGLSLLLSYVAFCISEGEGAVRFFEALYSSAHLLLLHMPSSELPAGDEFKLALVLLHIARLLAFIAWAATGVALITYIFGRELKRSWTIWNGNHTLICGLNGAGLQLAKEARLAGDKVVVIDEARNPAEVVAATESGASFLVGSPSDPLLLSRAGVHRAKYLLAAMDDDNANVAAILAGLTVAQRHSARRSANLHGFIHIADPQLRVLLRHRRAFRSEGRLPRVSIFNLFENSARLLLRNYPLDHVPIRPTDDYVVQIVVVGFGLMGEAVLTRAAMAGHYANLKRLRAIIIDRDAVRKERLFRSRYSSFSEVADARFMQLEADEPATRALIAELCSDSTKTISTIVVSLEDTLRGLSTALSLVDRLTGIVPIRLRVNDDSGVAALLDRHQSVGSLPSQITIFGSIGEACARKNLIEDEIDKTARALHEDYLRRLPEVERTRAGNRSAYPWDLLDDDLVDSNRQLADHIPVKLRAIGCHTAIKGSKDDLSRLVKELSKDEVERLAKMEHRRWMAERFLAGWSQGPKDLEKRTSPYLVEWEDLPADIQDYDRNFARILPGVLNLINLEIRQ